VLGQELGSSYKSLGAAAMTLNPLEFATLVVTGLTSCAEFGSYAFVHPVIRHLPPEHRVTVEKGLLSTELGNDRCAMNQTNSVSFSRLKAGFTDTSHFGFDLIPVIFGNARSDHHREILGALREISKCEIQK
jgi:hypothetical protein